MGTSWGGKLLNFWASIFRLWPRLDAQDAIASDHNDARRELDEAFFCKAGHFCARRGPGRKTLQHFSYAHGEMVAVKQLKAGPSFDFWVDNVANLPTTMGPKTFNLGANLPTESHAAYP